jgi:hypothetical protein
MQETSRGTVILSVECSGQGTSAASSEALHSLDRLLAHYGLPATWALTDLTAWSPPLRTGAAHEVALLADAAWAGPAATRAVFLRELESRINPARAAGVEVSSLVVAEGPAPDHCDLMYKLGLRCVRGGEAGAGGARNLRFGLWELPVSLRFPAAGWFASWRRARAAKRTVATSFGRPVHLAIDGAELSAGGLMFARLLDGLLISIARQRDAGAVQVQTMAGVARELGRSHVPAGASSILRPRAA